MRMHAFRGMGHTFLEKSLKMPYVHPATALLKEEGAGCQTRHERLRAAGTAAHSAGMVHELGVVAAKFEEQEDTYY